LFIYPRRLLNKVVAGWRYGVDLESQALGFFCTLIRVRHPKKHRSYRALIQSRHGYVQADRLPIARLLLADVMVIDRYQQVAAEQLDKIAFYLTGVGAQDANQAGAAMVLQQQFVHATGEARDWRRQARNVGG
jgi:hypothetical protein